MDAQLTTIEDCTTLGWADVRGESHSFMSSCLCS